jgi:enamine deaminase RidA (YjgF/YER057c/UK114 family)
MADGLQAINPGWPWYEQATFSPGVRKGNLLFISGMTAVDEDGRLIGPGNLFTQTEYIYNRIEQVVRAAGGTLDDIVMTTEYITTTEDYRRTAEIRRRIFTRVFPAATGVIVSSLLREGALIEISAIAVLDQ